MLQQSIRFLGVICLVTVCSFYGQSQQVDYVPGEILVKLYPEVKQDFKDWLRSKTSLHGQRIDLRYHKEISKPMDIHSIKFDPNLVHEIDLLNALNRDPLVQAAQFNHFVTLRSTIPNDPQFPDQWQYINTQYTPDADIDMDLAWDIATGGLTPDGDTIVACVIDDGINLNHPDFMDNLWVNHAEIPNNGIDDDNNGYVDDYYGWDTGSESDNVGDGGGHGTPVAGIVGAKGNNGIGVAGVNWNVKLMIVQGGTGVESEVLAAYSYPLSARKRYNATDGVEGAFVVSTNASWGIDQGQPSDAPLWCAFYDTLGVHGILNCGATANRDFNIDVIGDLPTGCTSEFLISVTNMNWDDEKVNQAGYGLQSVDLGAFGAGTWTTSQNSYGSFGGTSGATPHVTGTIALMYSAPCPQMIGIAKSNPGAAAAMIRDYIYFGVDPNASLEGITVTGGRLNVANAMEELMLNCGDCPPASRLQAESITELSTSLDWFVSDSVLNTHILLRLEGMSDWTSIENVTPPYQVENLAPCEKYEFQIVGFCSSDTTYSAIATFSTLGCGACQDLDYCPPANLAAANEWIERVAVGNMDVATGNNDGFGDFRDGTTTVLGQGGLIDVQLEPGFLGEVDEERWRIWIDFNQNGDFFDPGEQVINGRSSEVYQESFLVPADAVLGPTRMRVAMSLDASTWPCHSNSEFGEVEDYCVTIVSSTTACTSAEDLQANNITDSSADLTWIIASGGSDYAMRYRATSAMDWVEVANLSSASYNLTGLDYFTEYEFQVKTYCSETGSNSGFSDSEIFTTLFATSTHDLSSLQDWEAFPNPFGDQLVVGISTVVAQSEFVLSVVDQLGREVVAQRVANLAAGTQQLTLDTKDFAPGIYFLRLTDEAGNSTAKRVLKY